MNDEIYTCVEKYEGEYGGVCHRGEQYRIKDMYYYEGEEYDGIVEIFTLRGEFVAETTWGAINLYFQSVPD